MLCSMLSYYSLFLHFVPAAKTQEVKVASAASFHGQGLFSFPKRKFCPFLGGGGGREGGEGLSPPPVEHVFFFTFSSLPPPPQTENPGIQLRRNPSPCIHQCPGGGSSRVESVGRVCRWPLPVFLRPPSPPHER